MLEVEGRHKQMRVAFDIGGTFTDFVLEDARAGALQFHKVRARHGLPFFPQP